MKEEKIAAILVANFQVEISEEMITRAIKTFQMNFLYCVWAFNKNYEICEENNSDDDEDDQKSDAKITYNCFTYQYLIDKIIQFCDEEANQRVKEVAKWKLQSTENFL